MNDRPKVEQPIAFVIPSRARSGGVMNTVLLGNALIDMGYPVRLLYKKKPIKSELRFQMQALGYRFTGQFNDWVVDFKGKARAYKDINAMDFSVDEIVVAQGAYAVKDVASIVARVIKLRHCRGFSSFNAALMRDAWGGDMPTIAVASTLIDGLRQYGNTNFIGVVPNGKDRNKYYNEHLPRDGVGTLYYSHPNKCPDDTLSVISLLRRKRPGLPIYVFGTPRKPTLAGDIVYERYPRIDKVRTLYNRASVWFSTSKDEGLPNPILEAMACGTAVVSASNAGSRELIIDGQNGFLAPVRDTEYLVEKILLLLDNEDIRASIVNNASITANLYSWESAAIAMQRVIDLVSKEKTRH